MKTCRPSIGRARILFRHQRVDQRVGAGFGEDPREGGVAAGERAQRCADAAAHRELGQCRDGGGSGDADPDGADDVLGSQRGDPAEDRCRFEAELGHQRHFETAPARQCHLGPQCLVEGARGDPRVALGIAGKENLAQAVALNEAGRQKVVAVGERTHRMVGVAADDQGRPYLRFGRRTLQEVARLRETRQAAHRDMRHRVEPGAAQPRAGGDDVVMRDTPRMVDEHGRAGIEQLAQPLSGEVVARRDLDRARRDQLRDPIAPRRRIWRPRGCPIAALISPTPACAKSRRTRPRTTARHGCAAPRASPPGRRRC